MYWDHIRVGHLSPPPRAMGVTPLAFRALTAVRSSSQLRGAATSASARTFLLLNSRTRWVPRMGMPYGLPSTTAVLKTDGRKRDFRPGSLAMKSSSGMRRPAST
ncbi:hypothetical protein STANM309S_00583 [Streptomyces tanashiensis]